MITNLIINFSLNLRMGTKWFFVIRAISVCIKRVMALRRFHRGRGFVALVLFRSDPSASYVQIKEAL